MDGFRGLDGGLEAIRTRPEAPLSALAAILVRDGETAYEGYFGHRAFDASGRIGTFSVDRETRFRVASMSKPVTAVGFLRLVERGLVGLDEDLSAALGFPLRNPRYPEAAVTARMILSHTSSLRDAGFYFPPLPHGIRDLLLPGGRYWSDGAHWAGPGSGGDDAPGRRYAYCNLGYGILGTCMERLTGKRFDIYMRDEVLAPLGIDGGYNVNLLSDAAFANVAPLYRKAQGEEGPWDPDGPWIPQVDDYRGVRPALPVRVDPEARPTATLEGYEVGTNGALFSPQGGLRITALDLSKILRLFLGRGQYRARGRGQYRARGRGRLRSTRLLEERTVAAMTTEHWRYDPARDGGEPPGFTHATGLALARTETGLWGHHGDAYGLLGGMFFDPGEDAGFLYILGGTSRPAEELRSVEREIQEALTAALRAA